MAFVDQTAGELIGTGASVPFPGLEVLVEHDDPHPIRSSDSAEAQDTRASPVPHPEIRYHPAGPGAPRSDRPAPAGGPRRERKPRREGIKNVSEPVLRKGSVRGPEPGDAPLPREAEAGARPLVSVVLFCSQREVKPLEVFEDLHAWLASSGLDHQIVIALDGDRRSLYERFRERIAGLDRIEVVILNSRQGQLATIRAGMAVAAGRYLVTYPAYPQVQPESIPTVLEMLQKGADYVVGYRGRRRDSIFNRLASRLFNRFVRNATGLRFRDIACGMHGVQRGAMVRIPNYGDNQVFLPILAAREGMKVREIEVVQNPDEPRLRVFSPAVYLRRALSLVTLAFLVRFTQKPLRPFGALGVAIFLVGMVLSVILVYQRLFGNQPLADRPMLLLALLLVTAGIQVVILGLLGELLIYLHFRDQATYRVDEETGEDAGPDGPPSS
ncbi:MAG: glycosyltransferase [Candidatus Eisenbacteria bacterium]|nr:glycosyltransferase [Candidatus Latescibacterota bacterium]MBD3301926.1 glycosyltransferase [Candidatus Eisenbacteria bacterium]